MINRLKNKMILRLMKNTHLNATVCYAFITKIGVQETRSYIKGYEKDKRTDEEKYKMIFGSKR
jgi:hypothetical protein